MGKSVCMIQVKALFKGIFVCLPEKAAAPKMEDFAGEGNKK